MAMVRRFYLSEENKVFAGVCGGIGEYFEIDPVLVRIITVILFFATGFGLLAYIVCWIAMPKRPVGEPAVSSPEYSSWHKYIPGLILIGIGVVLLAREYWFWFDFGELWPLLLILAGVGLILLSGSRRRDESIDPESGPNLDNNAANNSHNGGTI